MTVTLFKICGGVLCVCALFLLIGKTNREFVFAASFLCSLLLLSSALTTLLPVFDFLKEETASNGFSDYSLLLFKCLGIALTVQTVSDFCRDGGEEAIANRLESVGKAEILLLALPLLRDLFSYAKELI